MRFLLVLLLLASSFSIEITSWTSQEKKVDFADHQSHPYQIAVERSQTTTPDEPIHCQAHGRKVAFNKSQQLFRLDTHLSEKVDGRQSSVLMNLLYLELEEEIIDFQVSEDDYYVVTTTNTLYYIKHLKGDKFSKPTKTELPEQIKQSVQKGDFFLLNIKTGIVMILGNHSVVCHTTQCGYIQDWQPILQLTHATFTKTQSGRQYLLITELSGFSVMEYTGNGKISNVHRFNQTLFNRSSVSLYDINPYGINNSQIYVLDYNEGVYLLTYQHDDPTKITRVEHIVKIEKCFSMDNLGYKYFVLICRSMADESDYIVQIHYNEKENVFTSLIPQQQQFQQIVDVQLTPNYYISWSRTGFKFYWMSKDMHYPEEFRKAGQLFFYNTVKARFRNYNNINYLYYATPNTIQRLGIKQVSPYVSCMSYVTTKQTYKIQYAVACEDNKQQVCMKQQTIEYDSTQHKQISIVFGVLPLILSFLGVILVIILIVVIVCEYKKKQKDILDKSESVISHENDLGDMMASNR